MSDEKKNDLNDDLYFYRLGVENLAKSNSADINFNSGANHAMIVMDNIFANAKREIKIFAGNFAPEVTKHGNYLPNLLSFLAEGGKIHVLLNEYDEKPNDILELLSRYSDSNEVAVKTTNEKLYLEDTGDECHFTIADDRMFRLEYDIKGFGARFSFNRPEVVKVLEDAFDSTFKEAKKIDWNIVNTHSL